LRNFREGTLADGIADVLRDMAARLEERTAEAVEYRTRLELTARAHSTAEEERRQLLEDLARERDRADRAEEEEEEARALRNLLEAPQKLRDGRILPGNGSGGEERARRMG